MSIQKKLEELKNATKKNITENKKFNFRVQKSIPDAYYSDYYEKYLRKASGDITIKEINLGKDENGRSLKPLKYAATPIHHYNTLLALAFTKAHKLYGSLRNEIKSTKNSVVLLLVPESNDDETETVKTLSGIECLTLSRFFMNGRNKQLVTEIKVANRRMLNEFMQDEQIIYKTLTELRNYYAHIFHEPGPVKFENFYTDEYKPEEKLSTKEWEKARNWFQGHFEDAKKQTIKSLNLQLEEKNITKKRSDDIGKVISKVSKYEFKDGENVSHDALLFIACFFLRKSDADYFVRKWVGAKNPEGPFKSTQNFFKHFTIRDGKSISSLNENLQYFRKIISLLSTMPLLKTESLSPFYNLIRKHNEATNTNILLIENNKNLNLPQKNKKIKKLREYIVPFRITTNYTYWYLKYLQKKGFLDGFNMAYYKTPEERQLFLEKHKITEGVEEYKKMIKMSSDEMKRELTAIYKESKKNFIFKEPSEQYDNYCIKKENAIAAYDHETTTGNKVRITITLSPDFLMKWVFADIFLSKGERVMADLISYIKSYYIYLSESDNPENFSFQNIPSGKILPSSIIKTVANKQTSISIEMLKRVINSKLHELMKFDKENKLQKAPWKFSSKRKIDYIFDYVHLVYSSNAFDENKNEETKRHEALNDPEYLKAFDFIRFFGKEYDTEEFINFFTREKDIYFASINKIIENATRLEELYENVFVKYQECLQSILTNISTDKLDKWKTVFKLYGPSLKSKVKEHAKLFSLNQAISPDIVNLKKMAQDSSEFNEWCKTIRNETWTTDYSLMRYFLTKKKHFSSSDYLFQEILPVLSSKKMLPLKADGKIKGSKSMFDALLRNKTDELMLWEIANYFWKQHSNVNTDYQLKTPQLVRNNTSAINLAYKIANPFSTIMQKELTIKVQRKGVTQNQQPDNGIHYITISPKKFDDEYQYYEQSHIIDYIEHYAKQQDKINGVWSFGIVNKNVKNIIAGYLDDAYMLLVTEKYIVQNNYELMLNSMGVDENSMKIKPFYFPFGKKEDVAVELPENLISRLILKEINPKNKGFNLLDFIIYRNKVMHQQLQPNPGKYLAIKKALIEFGIKHHFFIAEKRMKS